MLGDRVYNSRLPQIYGYGTIINFIGGAPVVEWDDDIGWAQTEDDYDLQLWQPVEELEIRE